MSLDLNALRGSLREFERQGLSAAPALIAQMAALCPGAAEKAVLARELASVDFPAPAREVRSVALFYFRTGNGGVEMAMTLLAHEFVKWGLRVTVVTHDVPDEASYPLPSQAALERLPWLDAADVRGSMRARTEELRRIVKAHDIDAFVDHAWLSHELLFDLMLCRKAGVRFVLNTHGVFTFPLAVEYDVRDYFSLLPRLVGSCDALVAETEVNRWFYAQFTPRAFCIPNPVDWSFLDRVSAQDRLLGPAPVLLWVGRFEERKRPVDAVRILAAVRRSIPDARLVMVGKSEDGVQEGLVLEYAADLGVAEAVELAGYQRDVAPFYRDAALLVSTTEIEGFNMVLLEASAAGLPAVMYRLSYLPFDRSAGVLSVDIGDVSGAAAAALGALSDAARYRELCAGALACFKEFRDYDYEAAWKSVFSGEAPAHERADEDALAPLAWDALFDHALVGTESLRAQARRDAACAAEDAMRAMREEYESSASYRVGRATLALPRAVRGALRRRRDG